MRRINLACIIDDDPIFIFGTKRIMELANFCDGFLIYNNGEDAFNALHTLIQNKDTLPEVILLDINMPVMDGWQFLDSITKYPIPEKVTIFIVTSSISPDDVNKAKKYDQVSNYIVKPITVTSLKDILLHIEPV